MLSSESITLAIHQPSSKIIHIDNALNGLACNCVCQECGGILEAIQGKKRQKHFRHHIGDTNCKGGIESGLHKLAKQILIENESIVLPRYGKILYHNAIAEKLFQNIIPDVSAILSDSQQIFIEIFHTHKSTDYKNNFFKNGQHKSVEIDMKHCPIDSISEIKDYVLNKTHNKTIIFWEQEKRLIISKPNEEYSLFQKIGLGFIAFILLRFAFPDMFKTVWKKMRMFTSLNIY